MPDDTPITLATLRHALAEVLVEGNAALESKLTTKMQQMLSDSSRSLESKIIDSSTALEAKIIDSSRSLESKVITNLEAKIAESSTTLESKIIDSNANLEARLTAKMEQNNAVLMGQFTEYFDRKLDDTFTERLAPYATKDELYTKLDGMSKRVTDDDHERAAIKSQLQRHDDWIGQLADTTHTQLAPGR